MFTFSELEESHFKQRELWKGWGREYVERDTEEVFLSFIIDQKHWLHLGTY